VTKRLDFFNIILPEADKEPEDEKTSLLLSKNPYMLSALIFIYKSAPDQNLPSNRGKMMQQLVRALAKREASRNKEDWRKFTARFDEVHGALSN
jgi:hypothetical protein